MSVRATKALREKWAFEAKAKIKCACGHFNNQHYLIPDEIMDTNIWDYVPNPAYSPGFHCRGEGCDCVKPD